MYFELIKEIVPVFIFIAILFLSIYNVWIFNKLIVRFLSFWITIFFLPHYLIIPLVLGTFFIISAKLLFDNKEMLKDHTVNRYYITFKLINNEVSYSAELEEFNKVKNWYESEATESYQLREKNRYINLSKVNIVEFSFEEITNLKTIFMPFIYYLTIPVPNVMNFYTYFKALLLGPILVGAYIFYERFMLNLDMTTIFNNTSMLNSILSSTIFIVNIVFFSLYLLFFVNKIFEMEILDNTKNYINKVTVQKGYRIYSYAVFNFLIIAFFIINIKDLNIHF